MIWLASFPRSGNTFLRNILYSVYGIRSSTYHQESSYPLDENYLDYCFLKTHELPDTLDKNGFDPEYPSVCLVRDGRDALSSMAHHRADLIEPGSDYEFNLQQAIIAEHGSYFGGWSQNAEAWLKRADLIIRYEDLIRSPLETVERLRSLIDLPEPRIDKLPTFEDLKFGIPEYGAGRHQDLSVEQKRHQAGKFFRRGMAGAWKDEVPSELQELFWSYHGETMNRFGYARDGSLREPHPDLDGLLRAKLGMPTRWAGQKSYRILIESDKLVSRDNDGVKRYQVELLSALFPLAENPDSRWHIDLYFHGQIRPLCDFRQLLLEDFVGESLGSQSDQTLEEYMGAMIVSEPPPVWPRPRVPLAWSSDAGEGSVPAEVVERSTQRVEMTPSATNESATVAFDERSSVIRPPGLGLQVERFVMSSMPRGFVAWLERHNVTLLHKLYEVFRGIISGLGGCIVWARGAVVRTLELGRDYIIRRRDRTRDSLVHGREIARDKLIRGRDLSRDQLVRGRDLSRDQLVRGRDLSRDQLVRGRDMTRGRLVHCMGSTLHSLVDAATPALDRIIALLTPDKDLKRLRSYDLIHLPLKQNYAAFRGSTVPHLITIHDMTHLRFPEFHAAENIRNATLGMEHALDSCASFLTISESTHSDLLADTQITEERVHLVYEAADPAKFHRKVNKNDCLGVRAKYGVDFESPYIICLSTLEPRKNLVNTIRAFIGLLEQRSGLELKLVIAGKRGWDTDRVYQIAADYPELVYFTDFVDDDDLPYLYSDALALSYLSFYEGFGLPPLEAMRCGTPVIYGDNSSLSEIIGDAGLGVDPYDLEAIGQKFLQVLHDDELRRTLSLAAMRRANQFSWRRAAVETLSVYEQVIQQAAAKRGS